jgi:ferredoxin
MAISIKKDDCVGCGLCLESCPYPGAIVMKSGRAVITDKCVECGACVDSCGTGAIEFEESIRETGMDLEQYKGVWVFVENRKKRIANVALELL